MEWFRLPFLILLGIKIVSRCVTCQMCFHKDIQWRPELTYYIQHLNNITPDQIPGVRLDCHIHTAAKCKMMSR